MIYTGNTIYTNRYKAVKKSVDILSVRFLVLCDNNLCNLTVLINTNIEENLILKSALLKRNDMTNNVFTIGYLVDCLYCRWSIFGKLNSFKCTVKNVSQMSISILSGITTVFLITAGADKLNNLKCIGNSSLNTS